ncbi:MAG: hypothetical protein IKP65_05610 [Alphaproteobacteria bacterium]|nr:hypothetical protein [Alphaproteobacteria bacterium]
MNTENLEFVVLAAGKSTRNYPHSKGIPHKSLIPFGSRKVIDFIMHQIILAGGKHITIVVADNAAIESFEQCFVREPEIEHKFEQKGNLKALELLQSLYIPDDVEIKYVIQEKPRGTGHAVGRVYDQIRSTGRNIVMIWPDDIVLCDKKAENELNRTPIYKRAVDEYIKMGCHGNLGITRPVPDPSRWGIIDEGHFKEKPKDSKSNQAAFGLFIFDKKVCEKLCEAAKFMDEDKAVEGIVGGELAFADALNKTVDEDPETQAIHTIPMLDTYTYLDCGTIEGYEKALLYTLLTESEFEDANLEFIKPLVDKLWEKREEKK